MFISTGICTQVALQAASALELQGLHAGVMHVHTIKPLDTATIKDSMESVPVVVTIEENNVVGGLGSAVAEIIAESGFDPPKQFARIGIPDTFPRQYGSQASLMETFQISPAHLVDKATLLHSQACQRTSR
jgi:transketolase